MTTSTITAIATPMGTGGVAIVRLSGSKAYSIGLTLTKRRVLKPRYAHFCKIYDKDSVVIDEALVLYFKAPHSFTGEDVLEIHGHGGMVLPNLILARTLELGAVHAHAGQFSYRAFDNHKLDLLQAESICDAISATTDAEAKSAIRSLSGEFSNKINRLLTDLINIRLYIESSIDFSDEEGVQFLSNRALLDKISLFINNLEELLNNATQGVLLKNGVQAVIAGKPNAGKSSLLNCLAKTDRAIVTDIAGTTRDILQESINLNGLSVHLTDTAGLRQTDDAVEQIGINRAKKAILAADLLILVYDLSQNDCPNILKQTLFGDVDDKSVLFLGNKADLVNQSCKKVGDNHYYVSCETGEGLAEFTQGFCQMVGFYPGENTIIARTRHIDALKRVLNFSQEAQEQLTVYQAGELAAESLRLAQDSLSELTGEFLADDLLGKIFGEFCIGK